MSILLSEINPETKPTLLSFHLYMNDKFAKSLSFKKHMLLNKHGKATK